MKNSASKLTEIDFDQMNFHDNTVYSIIWQDRDFRLVLDIDYIFEWIKVEDSFQFLVSPATLTFYNVWDLHFDIEPQNRIEINQIERSDAKRPRNADYIGKEIEWKWVIDVLCGEISFNSVGYDLLIRSSPVKQSSQHLSSDYRKELSDYLKTLDVDSGTIIT